MIAVATIFVLGVVVCVFFPARGRLAAALVLALASLVLIPADAFEVGALSSVVSLIAAFSFLSIAVLTAARPIRVTGTGKALIGLVAIGEVSALLAEEPNLFAMAVALIAPAVFVVASSLTSRERSAVLTAIVGLTLSAALFCAYEVFIIGRPLLAEVAYGANPLFDGTIRGQATLGHPLVAALVMLIGMGCALALRWRLVAAIPVIGLLALGVLSTGSSSAVVVSGLALAAAVVVGGGRRGRPFKIALLAVIGAVVANNSGTLLESVRADISGENLVHRTNSLIALPRLITERNAFEVFFGSGWGSAELLYRRDILIDDGWYAIDNQFTTILAVSGILGSALFIGTLFLILIRSKGLLRVTLLTILLMSASFDVLSWAATSSLFWFVAACALGESNSAEQSRSRNVAAGRAATRTPSSPQRAGALLRFGRPSPTR